jgi:hypothetical protein
MNSKAFALGCITFIIIVLIVIAFIYPNTIYDFGMISLTAISTIAWIILYISTRTLHCTQKENSKELICEIKGSREYNITYGGVQKYGGANTISEDNKEKLWGLINFLKLQPNNVQDNESYIANIKNNITLNKILTSIDKELVETGTFGINRGFNFAELLLKSIGIELIKDDIKYNSQKDNNKYIFFINPPDSLDINPEDNDYTLIGQIVYTPGHFIVYIKKHNDEKWYKINSLYWNKDIPEVDNVVVNAMNEEHRPYIWLYSKKTNHDNGVINKTPYHLLHFTNICYAVTPLQLLLATDLIDRNDSATIKFGDTKADNNNNDEYITFLDQILYKIQNDKDNEDPEVIQVISDIYELKTIINIGETVDINTIIYRGKSININAQIDTILEKQPELKKIDLRSTTKTTTEDELIKKLEKWINILNDYKVRDQAQDLAQAQAQAPVLAQAQAQAPVQAPAQAQDQDTIKILNAYKDDKNKSDIDTNLVVRITKIMLILLEMFEKNNYDINSYITKIVNFIGNIYKSSKKTNTILQKTFKQTNIFEINLLINKIKIYLLNTNDNKISIYIDIFTKIIQKNTVGNKQQDLLTQLTDQITDNEDENNKLFKTILSKLYDKNIKDNNIIPNNYEYYYQDPQNNKKFKIRFELNTYKLFYKSCNFHILILNQIKRYDEDIYNNLMKIKISETNETDNDNDVDDANTMKITDEPLLECMIEYIDYMEEPFEDRMLDNVNMIIEDKAPKKKKDNNEIIRYDIENFIPEKYRSYIYLFHKRNINGNWDNFNTVLKLIQWKYMLDKNINLSSLSNEDEEDELAEEYINEDVEDYDDDENIEKDAEDTQNQSIYYIQRTPIREFIKNKFIDIDIKQVTNVKLKDIISKKAKQLFKIFIKKVEFKKYDEIEQKVNNFINFVNNPFISDDIDDFGSGEPYITYDKSYSSESIKKISKRYGLDNTPFDKYYKKIINYDISYDI